MNYRTKKRREAKGMKGKRWGKKWRKRSLL